MQKTKWFVEENLIMPMSAETKQDAIRQLGSLLEKNGYVRETFLPAVLAREEKYATGLPTQPLGVAIPHTDSEHVLNRAVAVGILEKPVRFCMMGDSEDAGTDVGLIMMLAVPDKKDVMTMLQQVMGIIQNQDFLQALADTEERSEVVKMLDRELNVSESSETKEKEIEQQKSDNEVTLTINHPVGLHARPAALFVKTASQFKSTIKVRTDQKSANAKSILSVLTLGAVKGTVITLHAEGEDAKEALEAMTELVETNFHGVD